MVHLVVREGHIQLDAVMGDSVRYEGETLRLKCEITGQPLPRYSWFKDGQAIVAPPQQSGDVEQSRRSPGVVTTTTTTTTTAAAADRFSAKTTAWGSRSVALLYYKSELWNASSYCSKISG